MHPYRTHTCNALRAADAGKTVKLSGWIYRLRDHGGILFVDLRDHYGLTQIVVHPSREFFGLVEKAHLESVITVTGEVKAPTVLCVPIGTSFSECIALAGGAKEKEYFVVAGGPMMGIAVPSLEEPVLKNTNAILAFNKKDAKLFLATLTKVQRKRFWMREINGLTFRRIAEIEGVDVYAIEDTFQCIEKKIKKFKKLF